MLILAHGDNLADTKMYKSFSVSFRSDLLKSASISSSSDTYIEDDFSLGNSQITCGGTLINSSQQILMGLEITTQVRDNNLLHGNIV